jgi:hypothetical protein
MSAGFRTRGFHALAHDFRIVAESEAIGRHFERVLDGFSSCDVPEVEYRIRAQAEHPEVFEVAVDGGDEIVAQSSSVGVLVTNFVHHVNRKAISADYGVMAHAGGVERDGIGVVLPADPESGKTTLTAGLVRAGFAYLTDEAVTFDATTGLIEPFPKPLSVDAGSQHLFPELEPAPAPGDDCAPSDQWQVPPASIRPDAIGARCEARIIVFPRYQRGVTTELATMSRAEALIELATNTFEFRDHPRRSLALLARVVEHAQSFHLAVGDLDAACELIDSLVTSTVGEQRV